MRGDPRGARGVGTGIPASILDEEWEHLEAPLVMCILPDGDRGVVRCTEEPSLELDEPLWCSRGLQGRPPYACRSAYSGATICRAH